MPSKPKRPYYSDRKAFPFGFRLLLYGHILSCATSICEFEMCEACEVHLHLYSLQIYLAWIYTFLI